MQGAVAEQFLELTQGWEPFKLPAARWYARRTPRALSRAPEGTCRLLSGGATQALQFRLLQTYLNKV